MRPREALASAAALAGAHRLFTGLLAAGLVLRIVTFLAYRPALIYFDSTRYLDRLHDLQPGLVRPSGYPIFLWLLPTEWKLAIVPAVQHLFGLAIAVLIYSVLVRLGVRRTWSALATAPVLLDGYQLNIEQYILSEALFEMLLVSACVLLLWRRPPSPIAAAAAGLAIAGAILTRSSAMLVVVPAVLGLVFLRPPRGRFVALGVALLVPIVAYAAWFKSEHGSYALNGFGGQFLYARVAPFADCDEFDVPHEERGLCETTPPDERPAIDVYMWNNKRSPLYRLGLEREERVEVGGRFARRVILHQPLDYAVEVGADFLYGFWPTHSERRRDPPVSRWQFQREFPVYRDRESETAEILRADGYSEGVADRTLTGFLRIWQRFVYTYGPLLLICLVLGLVAAAGIGRARGSGLRTASFLFTFVALAVYGVSVAAGEFTWRYQLPLLVLLPPAGALGLAALTGRTARQPARE